MRHSVSKYSLPSNSARYQMNQPCSCSTYTEDRCKGHSSGNWRVFYE